ncbi:hypothetical protein ABVK25_010551 [Lepraria finkii]|uniref:Uncharacterized protein n=1 Tax=Lepraria finkii TaxID=1340010 RepID=A0ABR4AWU9_9LECA
MTISGSRYQVHFSESSLQNLYTLSSTKSLPMTPSSASCLILWIQLSALCSSAPPPSVSSAHSLANDLQNVTASINITSSTPSNFLPPNPFIYKIPQSSLTIRFQNYLRPLQAANVALCMLQASNKVMLHWCSDQPLDPTAFQTNSGSVSLKLVPDRGAGLTWYGWGETIRGLTYFVTTYGSLDMDFYVIEDGWTIAGGFFTSND